MHRSILSTLILLLFSTLCPAAERVALVIGNNDYQHMGKLANPQRDAQAVALTLRALKFDVEIIQDATAESFYEGLEKLKTRAAGAELALVYFAGHGVKIGDNNYLLPVDAELSTQAQLRTQALALEDLLADLEKTKVVAKVAILDCCRNDPLTRTWKTERSVGAGGLGELRDEQLPSSSLVMFSAGPGQVAADGAGGNSPFTASLVKRLNTPGQSLLNAFFGTSDDVMKVTAKRQSPWVKFDGSGQVFRELVMVPGDGAAPAVPLDTPGMLQISQQDLSNMQEELADIKRKINEAKLAGLKPVPTEEPPEDSREERQQSAAEASLGVFLKGWFQKQVSDSAAEWVSDFADSPNYCYWEGGGGAPRSFLLSDRQKLLTRYGRRSYEQIGKATVEWFEDYSTAILVVSYHYEYDGQKRTRGNSFVTMRIRQTGSTWKITDYDEHVRKNEYAGSSRSPASPSPAAAAPSGDNSVMLKTFLANWQRNNASNNPDDWVSDFDASVAYCYKEGGRANHAFLRNDRSKLINKRPNRSYTVTNAEYALLENGQMNLTVTYRYNYGGSVNGSCTAVMRLRPTNGRFLIVSFDEHVNKN